jgi:DNA repair protein RecO (recombination protein O)
VPLLSDHAIVLRLSDFSETSQVATLFARAGGKLRVLAKGARRGTKVRFATGLDLLEWGEILYLPAKPDAGLGTLTEWKQRDAFLDVRRSPRGVYAAIYAAERCDQLTAESDPHPALFDRLLGLLQALTEIGDAAQAEIAAALVRFLWALLEEAGFRPDLHACASCGRQRAPGRSAYFSPRAGGLLCRACAPRFSDHRLLPAAAVDRPEDPTTAEVWISALDDYLTAVAERPAASAGAMRAALGQPKRVTSDE